MTKHQQDQSSKRAMFMDNLYVMRRKGMKNKDIAAALGWSERELTRVIGGTRPISQGKMDGLKAWQEKNKSKDPKRSTPFKIALGAELHEARVAKALDPHTMAKTVGYSIDGYMNLERGFTGASKEQLEKICNVLPSLRFSDRMKQALATAKPRVERRPPGKKHKNKKPIKAELARAEKQEPPTTESYILLGALLGLKIKEMLPPAVSGVLVEVINKAAAVGLSETSTSILINTALGKSTLVPEVLR